MRKSTKLSAVLGGAALTVATVGVAFAYWTTSGSGSGSATAAASNGTLALSSATVSAITPGTNYPVAIKAANAGTTDLRVDGVSTVISSSNTACQALITSGDSGLTFADVNTSGVNVAAAASDVTIGTGSLNWANSVTVNQNACKSAPLTLTFTGTSA